MLRGKRWKQAPPDEEGEDPRPPRAEGRGESTEEESEVGYMPRRVAFAVKEESLYLSIDSLPSFENVYCRA